MDVFANEFDRFEDFDVVVGHESFFGVHVDVLLVLDSLLEEHLDFVLTVQREIAEEVTPGLSANCRPERFPQECLQLFERFGT